MTSIFLAVLVVATAPAVMTPTPKQLEQLSAEAANCGADTYEAFTALPQAARKAAASCVMAITTKTLNSQLPKKVGSSLIFKSITAEGMTVRFLFVAQDNNRATSVRSNSSALAEKMGQALCNRPGFSSLRHMGATYEVRFEDASGKKIFETMIDSCGA